MIPHHHVGPIRSKTDDIFGSKNLVRCEAFHDSLMQTLRCGARFELLFVSVIKCIY